MSHHWDLRGRTKHPATDYTGTVLGSAVVVRRKPRISNFHRYDCKCPCGTMFVLTDSGIRGALERGSSPVCPECRRKAGTATIAQCTDCERFLPLDAEHFFRHSLSSTGFQSQCKECQGSRFGVGRPDGERRPPKRETRRCTTCGSSTHHTKNCGEAPRRGKRPCRECEGMPWRREAPYCARCGEPYAPEPPVTVDELLARPRDESRTMPAGGQGWRKL